MMVFFPPLLLLCSSCTTLFYFRVGPIYLLKKRYLIGQNEEFGLDEDDWIFVAENQITLMVTSHNSTIHIILFSKINIKVINKFLYIEKILSIYIYIYIYIYILVYIRPFLNTISALDSLNYYDFYDFFNFYNNYFKSQMYSKW